MEFFIKSKPLHFWIFHRTPAAPQISTEIPTLASKNVFSKFGKHRGPGVCRFSLILGCVRGEIFPVALCSIRPPLFLHGFLGETRWWASLGEMLFAQAGWQSLLRTCYVSESDQRGGGEIGVKKRKIQVAWCHLGWPHNERKHAVLHLQCPGCFIHNSVCMCVSVDSSQWVVW